MPNFDRDEKALGYYTEKEEIKAFLCYPIGEKGVFVIDSKKRWSFSDKEKRMLPGISSLFLQIIEEEKKLVEIEERIEMMEKSRKIINLFRENPSVGELLRESALLSLADLSFVTLERKDDLFVEEVFGEDPSFFIGKRCGRDSIVFSAFSKGSELILPLYSSYLKEKPLLFQGEKKKPKQIFLFPLRAGDNPFGILGFASETGPLKEETIDFLRELSVLLSFYYRSLLTEKYLRRLEYLEPLTKTLHFPYFLLRMQELTKKREAFSLFSFRIRNLEHLNERIGIEKTNEFLKKVAHLIKYHFGEDAIVTRKSGGSFYVLSREKENPEKLIETVKISLLKIGEEEAFTKIEDLFDCWVFSYPEQAKTISDLLKKLEKKE